MDEQLLHAGYTFVFLIAGGFVIGLLPTKKPNKGNEEMEDKKDERDPGA